MKIDQLMEFLRYDHESGDLFWKKSTNRRIVVGSKAGTLRGNGRLQVCINGKIYLSSRLAWALYYKQWPINEIDHIDGNPLNNAIVNLRDVTRKVNAQNQRKAHKGNSSGYLGVRRVLGCTKSKKWEAVINVNGSTRVLGRFTSPEEAYQRYVEAKRLLHEGCTL